MAYSEKLKSVLSQIKKTQGAEILIDLETKNTDYPLLCSTGSLGLDIALGGGWAKGRIIEVYGPESSGKTTAALHAIVNIQKSGRVAAFIDAEQSFDITYFKALGGDIGTLIFAQPDNAEQVFNIVEALAESGEVALIVIDSTNTLVPKSELEGESGDLKVGLIARLLGQHLRKVLPSVKNGTTLFFISQIRQKIGVIYGSDQVVGVGNAMKFACSQRVEFRKIESIKDGEDIIANLTKATVKKNKVAPPFKEAYFNIIFGEGISQDSEIIDVCLGYEILKKTGAGVILGYESILYGNGAIDSTEAKTVEALKTPAFASLYKEIKGKLDLHLEKITQSDFDLMMAPLYEVAKEDNELFQEYWKRASTWSGKSKYLQSKYYSELALEIRPTDKASLKKLNDMKAKLSISPATQFVIEIEDDLKLKGGLILTKGTKIDTKTGDIVPPEETAS